MRLNYFGVVCSMAMLAAACGDSTATMDSGMGDGGGSDAARDAGADMGPVDMNVADVPVVDMAVDMSAMDMTTGDMGVIDPLCPSAVAHLDCTSGTVMGNTAMGASAIAGYCDPTDTSYGGNESTYVFENTTTANVTIAVTSTTSLDFDLFALDAAGTACGPSSTCLDQSTGSGADETVHFTVAPGQRVYVSYGVYGDTGTADFTLTVSCTVPACGDSLLNGDEQCDDGNTMAGDGCSDTCVVEGGSWCDSGSLPSTCRPIVCGDGYDDAPEACDDSGTAPADGCSATCTVETGYSCDSDSATTCTMYACGDGTLDPAEGCDDGNTTDGDGCSATCTIEAGARCTHPRYGSDCVANACGDGFVFGTEGCDDGNTTDGDGCSATCTVEATYACGGARVSVCVPTGTCGDGTWQPGESCDDGNTTDGDGCSATCAIEGATSVPASGASTTLMGALTPSDPRAERVYSDCTVNTRTPHYDTYTLVNGGAAAVTIDLTLASSGDGFLTAYDAPYDPAMPEARCVLANDDFGTNHSRIQRLVLAPGAQVVVVVTEYDAGYAIGPYALTVTTE